MIRSVELSPCEWRVVEQALGAGSVKEIAARLKLAERTVNTYLTRIYWKVGVGSRVELILRYVRGE